MNATLAFGMAHKIAFAIYPYLNKIFFATFLLCAFYYCRNYLEDMEAVNITRLFTQIFIAALFCGSFTLLIGYGIIWVFNVNRLLKDPIIVNILYHLCFAVYYVYLFLSLFMFKKMILYQKNRTTTYLWNGFHFLVLVSILMVNAELRFNTLDMLFVLPLIGIIVFILSTHIKWIPFLKFRDKLYSILLITGIFLINSGIVFYYYQYREHPHILMNVFQNYTFIIVSSFLLVYNLYSWLVLFFNLPTSSVFEQKIEDVKGFQQFSQMISVGQNEDQIYDFLIGSAQKGSLADGFWLEIFKENRFEIVRQKDIETKVIEQIKTTLQELKPGLIQNILYFNKLNSIKEFKKLKIGYKSLLCIPLNSHNTALGNLFLLKEFSSGFEQAIIDLVAAFTNQASVAIENSRLINESIDFRIYKEELNIARRVQNRLLPKKIPSFPGIDLDVISVSADQVGGDYYDIYFNPNSKSEYPKSENSKSENSKYNLVIGDISGKGTTAAFNTAQMKGVFQSLVQMDYPPSKFIYLANDALSRCLEKDTFITLLVFQFNILHQKMIFTRAGHCPAIYYSAMENKAMFLNSKGLGLGIIRDESYLQHIEEIELPFHPGDKLILYTDGIVEQKNHQNIQFGYERLLELVTRFSKSFPKELNQNIISEIDSYISKDQQKDDYTLLTIQFKE